MEAGKGECKGKCKCPCHMMVGVLISIIGLLFILGNFEIISVKAVNMFWPIMLLLIGLKISIVKCKCCPDA